jgi:hypothetical protein
MRVQFVLVAIVSILLLALGSAIPRSPLDEPQGLIIQGREYSLPSLLVRALTPPSTTAAEDYRRPQVAVPLILPRPPTLQAQSSPFVLPIISLQPVVLEPHRFALHPTNRRNPAPSSKSSEVTQEPFDYFSSPEWTQKAEDWSWLDGDGEDPEPDTDGEGSKGLKTKLRLKRSLQALV